MSINPKPVSAPVRASGRASVGRIVTIVGTLMLAAALLPVARVMLVGMAPTLVVYLLAQLVARGDERHGVLCVGICNLAGLAPFAIAAMKAPGGVAGALGELGVMLALLAAYGAAALGWLIYRVTPPAYARLLRLRAEHRLARVAAEQDGLIADWGEEVAAEKREN